MIKNPTDPANVATEEALNAMEEEISSTYAEAHAEMVEKLLNFLFTIDDINDARQIYAFFRMKQKMKLAALKSGKISQKEYNAWKAKAIMAEKSWLPVQKTLAEDLTHSHEIATSIINDKKCDVYALNHNYATYEIEKGIGASTSFALYDHDTVERLIAKKPNLLPIYKVNTAKDMAWNMKHIRHAVTQGILQGESNQDIAKRMQKVCDMSEHAAIRTARTATTCAQNSGRIDGYKRAQDMGIGVKQIWVSTLDGRTRHEHRVLMGQRREIGVPFEVDGHEIMFPGDPNAKPSLVYNCRCTLIAEVDGVNYNLEDRIEETLKKKDLTWDEWIKEQPLPRHYDEDLHSYLKRYSAHHKKMKFSDWLEEQVMPDVLITKAWADKKMSNIYNLIKEQNVTDANKFYKELGKLGKPSEVWEKYLLGELDAIDLKQFEEILKKYLPKETTPVSTKAAKTETKAVKETIDLDEFKEKLPLQMSGLSQPLKDELSKANLLSYEKYMNWRAGKIDSPEFDKFFKEYQKQVTKNIEDLEKQIKYTKSDPMSFDDADMHHVNPAYKGNSGIYAKNCQTCAMTYEARRQGYDVVALGKDPTHPHTHALQQEMGQDQANGWINKMTGEKPVHLNCPKGKQKYKWLEDTVGHNGERYTLSVRWKVGGAHVINMDRDANGVLRLIDNQRGPNEKHIWTGEKEIKQYLDSVKNIKYVLRVDDCIPNPKYFNMITKEAKVAPKPKVKHKESLWTNSNIDYSKLPDDPMKLNKKLFSNGKFSTALSDISNKTGLSASEVWEKYTKQELFTEDIKKLDEIIEKFDEYLIKSAEPAKNVLDKSQFINKKMSAVYTDIKKTDVKTANQFYKTLQSMGKPSDIWDKYVKGELSPELSQKIEKHLQKKYSTLEEAMPGESVTGLDIDTLSKKKVTNVYDDLAADGSKTANKFYKELKDIANAKGYKSQSAVWKKYLAGELDFEDIEKIDKYVIKKYQTTVSTPGIEPSVKIDYDKLPNSFLAVKNKFAGSPVASTFSGTLGNFAKKYNCLKSEIWEKYKKKELTESEMKQIDDIVGKLDEYTVKDTVSSKIDYDKLPDKANGVYEALDATKKPDFFAALFDLSNDMGIYIDDVWEKYIKQELSTDQMKKLDDIVGKLDEYTVKSTTPATAMTDDLKNDISKFLSEIEDTNPELAEEIWKYMSDTYIDADKAWTEYWDKKWSDPDLNNLIEKAGFEPPKTTKFDTKTDLPKNMMQLDTITKTEVTNYLLKTSPTADWVDYWHKYKADDIDDPGLDKILGINKTTPTIDYDNLPAISSAFASLQKDISNDEAQKFLSALVDIKKHNGISSDIEVWGKYQKQQLPAEDMKKLDDIIGQLDQYTVKPHVSNIDYNSLPSTPIDMYDKLYNVDKDTAKKFSVLFTDLSKKPEYYGFTKQDLWDMYKKQTLNAEDIKKIDEFVEKVDKYTAKSVSSNVDYNKLPDDWMQAWSDLLDLSDVTIGSDFDNALISIAKSHGWYKQDAWDQYVQKKLSKNEMEELDKFIEKLDKYTIKTTSSNIDYDKLPDGPANVYAKLKGKLDSDSANAFKNLLDDIANANSPLDSYDIWKKYKKKELSESEMKQIDDIVSKLDQYTIKSTSTSSVIDYDNLPSAAKMYQDLNDNISNSLATDFYSTLYDITPSNESILDTWEKYKKKQLTKEQMEKIDKTIEPLYKKGTPTPTPAPKPSVSKPSAPVSPVSITSPGGQKLVDLDQLKNKKVTEIYNEIKNDSTSIYSAGSFYNELKTIGKNTGIGKQGDVWAKYVAGELDPADAAKIDKYVIKNYNKTTASTITTVDKNAVPSKVTAAYNKIKDELGSTDANKFYNELKKIGKDKGYGKQSDVWNKYLLGQLDAEDVAKIDKHLITIKDYTKTEDLPPVFDKSEFANKKMSQVYNELKAKNVTDANKFYNYLKGIGKPSFVWQDYLDGKLIKEQADEIEKYLKKLSSKQQVSSATASAPSGSKLTPQQQKALDDAKKELEQAKAALPDNKKYSGIWKDEVSLSDYAAKKKTIAAKKVYFEDELQKAKDLKNQNPHQPGTSQYDGYIKWNQDQIDKFEKLLVSIDEFERLGKEYEKAQKVVEKAQKKVDALTPEAEMYSQERKDKAKWFTSSQYSSGDRWYSKWTKAIHQLATSIEHRAYKSYTSASGRFNRPLAGFKSPAYSGASGWDQKYFKGIGKVDLDNEHSGDLIRGLTSFIEKSKVPDDIWIQTAQDYATLEGIGGFLNIPYGALSGMTDSELQQFVGVENQLGQFVSGAINRGGGSYNPGNMRINIYLPKGSEALYVLSDGTFGKREHEIILQRGGTYKITKIYWGRDAERGGRKLMVDMELRLEKGYNKYGQ